MDTSIRNNSPGVPHLSPSLTASVNSVNSSSLPSPNEGSFVHRSQLSDAKFPADDSPRPRISARRTSSCAGSNIHPPRFSDPHSRYSHNSTSWTDSVRARTTAAQKKMTKRFRPYDPRGVASPLELRFAARSLGFSSHIGLTAEDVLQGREHFLSALSTMPDRILKKAYQARHANRECAAQRLSLTLAEIESAERHKDYLIAVKEDCAAGLSISDAQLDILKQLMDERSLDNVEDDGGFHRAVYADELISLSIANGQITQMHEAVLSRPGCWSIPGAEDSSVLGSDDLDEEQEEEVELPSSDPCSESDEF